MADNEEQQQAGDVDEAKVEDQNGEQQEANQQEADQNQSAEAAKDNSTEQEPVEEEGTGEQAVAEGEEAGEAARNDQQLEDNERNLENEEQGLVDDEVVKTDGQTEDQELIPEDSQQQAEASQGDDQLQTEGEIEPDTKVEENSEAQEDADDGGAKQMEETGQEDSEKEEKVGEEITQGQQGLETEADAEQSRDTETVENEDAQEDQQKNLNQEMEEDSKEQETENITDNVQGEEAKEEDQQAVQEDDDEQEEEKVEEADGQEITGEQIEAPNIHPDEAVAEQASQEEENAEETAATQLVTEGGQEKQVESGEAGDEAAVQQEAGEEEQKDEQEVAEEEKEEQGEQMEESAAQEQEVTEPQTAEAEAEAEAAAETEVQATTGETQEEAGDSQAQEGAGDQTGDVQLEKQEAGLEGEEQLQLTQEQSDLNQSANAPASTSEDISAVPPAPHLPTPMRSHTEIEGQMSTSALNVVWSFGLNRNVPVLNLSDGVRQAIMYPCAHVGIMYDFKNNKQHILQAHLNPITCSAVSQDKRWLVTGDVGPDAMVNIWDTYTGTPIQTMFDPNPSGGVVAVALTPDSRYLATMSALPVQTLAIWDWTVDGDVPLCSADLKPEYGMQNFIYFDPTDIHHVVTNSETQVLFYHWDTTMNYYAPPLTDSDFNKPVGRYSQSVFQIGIARALTATSIGNLVVWDNNKPLSKFMDVNQSADKKPLKIIKVHDKGINVLTTTDNYIVLGDTAGHVKFYDQGLRLIYWYADFHTGPCTAISFAHMPDFVPIPSEGQKFPSDATKSAKPFVVRDFVVGTAIAVYGNVNTDGSKFKVIHREHDAAVHALAAHPKLPIIAMGSYSGLLKLWNYRTKETVASRMFDKLHIQTCAFDPKGLYIALGCTNGAVFLVDSVALLDQLAEPYRYAKDTITHIAFSHNSTYFATADAGFAVTVFKRQRKQGRNPYIWHGRYRSHYKPIKDLIFGTHLDTNEPKLLTLGEDRMLIEYELNHSGKTNNHVVPCAEDRIEQSALTQCMAWYPPITKENFLLTANDQYKLKCYNSVTKMCRKTVLGPTYGSPMRKMMVVPTTGPEHTDRYLAYITDDKVGLHFLPATGNPHLAMALIAHPSGVSNLACSFDGAYLFTAGGPDYAVHMWEINISALEAQAKLGGEDLIPFYGLLEGGRDGEMFAELEDLFYYAQLRHQGINSMETREIGNRVPISEVPFIMRAMGYYPSEQEIEDMLNEIKYNEYVNLGQYQEDIDLGSFIKLYINHRPAFGLSPEKLLWAFQTLAESPELGKGGYIERGDMLDLLQKKGEHMTEYELAEHLTTLLGFNREGGSCEQEPFDADSAGSYIAENLPFDLNAEVFINEILGFSMTVDPPAADDTKDVIKSEAP